MLENAHILFYSFEGNFYLNMRINKIFMSANNNPSTATHRSHSVGDKANGRISKRR